MDAADYALFSLALIMAGLLAAGASKATRRAGGPNATRVGLWVVAALCGWLALVTLLTQVGVFADPLALPPRVLFLPLAAFIAMALVLRTTAARRLIAVVPRHWPIAAQTFRVGVELVLFAYYTAGRAPEQITFAGRNFDVLVGASAPIVAWLLATGRVGRGWAIGWNIAGLVVLANTVVTVVTSAPGPLHLDWDGPPLTAITEWPVVWLPALLMPTAVFLHVVSLRQMLAAQSKTPHS